MQNKEKILVELLISWIQTNNLKWFHIVLSCFYSVIVYKNLDSLEVYFNVVEMLQFVLDIGNTLCNI